MIHFSLLKFERKLMALKKHCFFGLANILPESLKFMKGKFWNGIEFFFKL